MADFRDEDERKPLRIGGKIGEKLIETAEMLGVSPKDVPISENGEIEISEATFRPPVKKGLPRGKPFEKGSAPAGPGRPKGVSNRATMLKDKYEALGFDPVVKLVKLQNKKALTKDDKIKGDWCLAMISHAYPKLKQIESHSTEDKSMTITWNIPEPTAIQIQMMETEMGLIESPSADNGGGIIDADILENEESGERLPIKEDDDERSPSADSDD
jgi:hypothetical protein